MFGLINNGCETKKADYIIKTLFDTMGIEHPIKIDFEYPPLEYKIIILYDSMLNKEQLVKFFQNEGCLIYIPSVKYGNHLKEYLTEAAKAKEYKFLNGVIFEFDVDIVLLAFSLLTCDEEITNKKRDVHNRFIGEYSVLNERDMLTRPIINEIIIKLLEIITKSYKRINQPFIQKWYWPEGKPFAAALTHDIDVVKKYTPYRIKEELKKNPGHILNISKAILNGSALKLSENDPFWSFDIIIEKESRFGYKSSFYFAAGIDNKGLEYDPDKIPIVKDKIRGISRLGYEIGLHAGYYSYENEERIYKEKGKIEAIIKKDITGVRQHALRFKVPITWKVQEKSGFGYDTTVGFPDYIGFRAGVCYPYYPYSILDDSPMDIIEIPLMVMDTTLEGYRKLNADEAWSPIKDLLDTISRFHGLATILWHNNTFDDTAFPGWGALYDKVLKELNDRNAFVGSSEMIYNWWIKRNALILRTRGSKNGKCFYDISANEDIDNLCLRIENGKYEITGNNIPRKEQSGENVFITFPKLHRGEKIELVIFN